MWRICSVGKDYGYGTRDAAVFTEYSKDTSFLSHLRKENTVSKQRVPSHYKARRQKGRKYFSLKKFYFNFFFCAWLSCFSVIGLAHTVIPLQFSPVLHTVNSHISVGWGWIVKKNLCLLFPFILTFMFIQRLNEFSVFLLASFLLISSFPVAPTDLHCMHRHQIGKECKEKTSLGNRGKEKQSGFPNVRQNYVPKLKSKLKKSSFSEVSVPTVSQCAFDFETHIFITKPCALHLPVAGS